MTSWWRVDNELMASWCLVRFPNWLEMRVSWVHNTQKTWDRRRFATSFLITGGKGFVQFSNWISHEVAFGRRKWQIGGGGRMAVSLDSVNESEWSQSKISWCDTHLANFHRLFPVRDQMKALEGPEVKFPCFLGIVHPTIFQRRGLGTLTSQWLVIL